MNRQLVNQDLLDTTSDHVSSGGSVDSAGSLMPLPQFAAGLAVAPAARRVTTLWNDQRHRWLRGKRPSVEEYLTVLPPPLRDEVLLDLIYGEFVLRLEEGERPRWEDYATRFPEQRGAIRRQLQMHEALTPITSELPPPAALPEGLPLETPAEIAGYRIVAALDAGGQGQIFRGVHPTLGRDVVIKLGHRLIQPGSIDALVREGRILAELDDPGLARVYDLQMHEDRPCLVMEYVRGVNLEQHVRRQPLAPRDAAAVVARVARALATVHRRGVVHYDVKPRNIVMDDAGKPRLIDFGLSRLADAWRPEGELTGSMSGTVLYMAPEQARGEAAGPSADLFSLGGVLYFLLTGHEPYTGQSFTDVHEQAKRGEWDRAALDDPRLPSGLRMIALKAMATEPAERYRTAEEMAAVLEAFAQPRRPWLWLTGAAAVAALVVLAVWRPWHRDGAPMPPPSPIHPNPAPVVVETKPRPISLQVRVWRAKTYQELLSCVPLGSPEQLRFEALAPSGMHSALFVLSGGKLERLLTEVPEREEKKLSFPKETGKSAKFTGSGNEVILFVARASGPIDVEDLKDLISGSPWPELPDISVLRMTPDAVKVVQKDRGFSGTEDRPDPEGEVKGKLDELRQQLRKRFDHVEGLAFTHRQ